MDRWDRVLSRAAWLEWQVRIALKLAKGPLIVGALDPYLNLPKPTFCRVPIKCILGLKGGTYKKVGYGSSGYARIPFMAIEQIRRNPCGSGRVQALDGLWTSLKIRYPNIFGFRGLRGLWFGGSGV